MSSLPLTFNNGQTETTSEISVVTEGRDSTKRNLIDIPFLPTNEDITRVLQNKPREKSYLVTTLIKDGVDENNRPLYKREIRSFNSVKEAKNFKETVDNDGINSEAFIAGGTGTVIATGSTKDGEKTFDQGRADVFCGINFISDKIGNFFSSGNSNFKLFNKLIFFL